MTQEEKEKCLELAMHTIGMDNRKVYTTHGEKVFVPYRNYFSVGKPEKLWELMVKEGYASRHDAKNFDGRMSITYSMTPNGKQWMAKELQVNICLTY